MTGEQLYELLMVERYGPIGEARSERPKRSRRKQVEPPPVEPGPAVFPECDG